MIIIKDKQAQAHMSTAGELLAQLFVSLTEHITPGVSTLKLDSIVDQYLQKHKLVSSSKGYLGYKHASCISLNDEVVHGVPSAQKLVCEGDLVKIDVCASYQGYCADMARCYFVGTTSQDVNRFVTIAQSALNKGIEQAAPGKRITDISAAIQKEVEQHNYGVVREFAGHGIGKKMHEDPEILNYGKPGCGPVIRSGMAFAIEPMITMGDYRVYVTRDGWTVKTMDKSMAAHVEDTVIVTDHGPHIITRLS